MLYNGDSCSDSDQQILGRAVSFAQERRLFYIIYYISYIIYLGSLSPGEKSVNQSKTGRFGFNINFFAIYFFKIPIHKTQEHVVEISKLLWNGRGAKEGDAVSWVFFSSFVATKYILKMYLTNVYSVYLITFPFVPLYI